jgi:hypothetical protein
MPGQNAFGGFPGRVASRPSPVEVAVDTIGGEDERIPLGYPDNIRFECRQLMAYYAGAQQQRFLRPDWCCAWAKQDTHHIPYA